MVLEGIGAKNREKLARVPVKLGIGMPRTRGTEKMEFAMCEKKVLTKLSGLIYVGILKK